MGSGAVGVTSWVRPSRLVAVSALLLAVASCRRGAPVVLAEPVEAEGAAAPLPAPTPTEVESIPTVSPPEPLPTSEPSPLPVEDWPAEFRWPEGYTPPEIWEQKRVVIDGVAETWTLRWKDTPMFNGCDSGMGCACMGLEWGLVGDLELVRERPGAPTERLDLAEVRLGRGVHRPGPLGALVSEEPAHSAQIAGFVRTRADDGAYDRAGHELRPRETRMTEIVKRRHVEIMKLRDYDHDGLAAEFVFSVGYLACGQNPSVLVGVSRDDMHLHVFDPTMVYRWEWDRILAARGRSIDVEYHVCGDHGGGGDYATVVFDPVHGMHSVEDSKWECVFDEKTGPQKKMRRRVEK
jgi:hypothetical protein